MSPLLPPSSTILVTLSSPLSPTSSPLRSTVIHLRELLRALRERCAPARDPQIDALLLALDDPPDSVLAKTVIDVIRAILKLADEMKDDLSQFVIGSMSEQQLKDVITGQAISRERDIVRQLWKPTIFRELWERWINEIEHPAEQTTVPIKTVNHKKFVRRLMHALGTNKAVSCELPTISVNISPTGTTHTASTSDEMPVPAPNPLPPPLLFITPTLFTIQNYLQGLVIAASLRALVRIPTTPAKRKLDTDEGEDFSEYGFMQRIWTLLQSDIEGEYEASESDIKVVNLADEVVRISKAYGVDDATEARLRQAVDRTLRDTDPVFVLLQKRLIQAITAQLLQHAPVVNPEKGALDIRAGRNASRATRRPNIVLESEEGDIVHLDLDFARENLAVKGFDHPVLVNAVSDVILRLRQCIAWTEAVWPDLLEKA